MTQVGGEVVNGNVPAYSITYAPDQLAYGAPTGGVQMVPVQQTNGPVTLMVPQNQRQANEQIAQNALAALFAAWQIHSGTGNETVDYQLYTRSCCCCRLNVGIKAMAIYTMIIHALSFFFFLMEVTDDDYYDHDYDAYYTPILMVDVISIICGAIGFYGVNRYHRQTYMIFFGYWIVGLIGDIILLIITIGVIFANNCGDYWDYYDDDYKMTYYKFWCHFLTYYGGYIYTLEVASAAWFVYELYKLWKILKMLWLGTEGV